MQNFCRLIAPVFYFLLIAVASVKADQPGLSDIASQFKMADSTYESGNLEESIELFKDIIESENEVTDKKIIGEAYLKIAFAYEDMSDLENAQRYYKQSADIYESIGERKGQSRALTNYGNMFVYLGELEKALEAYQTSLAIDREIKNYPGICKNLDNSGVVYGYFGEFDKSLELHNESLTLAKETDDLIAQANSINNIGTLYAIYASPRKAMEYFEESYKLNTEMENERGQAEALTNLGNVIGDLGDYDTAIEKYEHGLEIAVKLGNKIIEGRVLMNIGLMHDYKSDYTKALKFYETSLEINRITSDKMNEAMILNNIGLVYSTLHDHLKAKEFFEKSLNISLGTNDLEGISICYNNLGMVFADIEDYELALDYYNQSLEISRDLEDLNGIGTNLMNIGKIHYETGEYDLALKFYQEDLELSIQLENPYEEIQTLRNIGLLYTKQEKFEDAENVLDETIKKAEELNNTKILQHCLAALAFCYAEQEKYTEAINIAKKSIKAVEDIRGELEAESQRSSYSAGISDEYGRIVNYLVLNKQYDEAFNYMERGRARSFLDLLASGEVKIGKGSHQKFLEEETKLALEIEAIEEELAFADSADKETLRGKIKDKRGLIQNKTESQRTYEPELASLVTVSASSIQDVQDNMEKNTSILEYYLTEKACFLFLITKESFNVFNLNTESETIADLVAGFRQAIVNNENDDDFSRKLYKILIEPASKSIKTKYLTIIPHHILHYLPFHALSDNKGKYLVEKYRINYLPSASVQKYLTPKIRDKGEKILVFGNPQVDYKACSSLPFAEHEARVISDMFNDSKLLTGAEASEATFNDLAPEYDIIHLACHGELNSAYPLFSGLLLSSDQNEDGQLNVHELFSMDIHPYLVVLSACQTGLGHLTNGDELVGLSRAFIYAGTPSIISSLWMVEDESTAYLMQEFYKNLKKKNKAEALRKAQLKTMKKFKNTRSWASFVLLGDKG